MIATVSLCLLLIIPLVSVFVGMGKGGEMWQHVAETVLFQYVWNSLWLLLSVSVFSVAMALPSAWFLSRYRFPGKTLLQGMMLLPLAIPGYVAAIVYLRLPEMAIPLLVKIRTTFGFEAYQLAEALLRQGTLSLLLAAVLSPYIHFPLRTAFQVQRRQLLEAAQLLGRSPRSQFFTVALPLARPALMAGLALVCMEVLNEYGAPHFFGVPTLTVGVFRTWFGLGDSASAVRLAGGMMLLVLMLLGAERFTRGRARFVEAQDSSAPAECPPLKGRGLFWAYLSCGVPLLIGFWIPILVLIHWSIISWDAASAWGRGSRIGESFLIAGLSALAITLLALLAHYSRRLHPLRWLKGLLEIAQLGYAVPGVVVAVGVLLLLGPLGFSGSLVAIGLGYLLRFFAVAGRPLQAAMLRVCGSMDEASRLLGRSPLQSLTRITFPLIRGSFVAVVLLVFVDILKELPLSMLLRPAQFETLATLSFGLASEGRIQAAAFPSLLMVLLAVLALVVMNRVKST